MRNTIKVYLWIRKKNIELLKYKYLTIFVVFKYSYIVVVFLLQPTIVMMNEKVVGVHSLKFIVTQDRVCQIDYPTDYRHYIVDVTQHTHIERVL